VAAAASLAISPPPPQAQYTIKCMPRLWWNDVLLWEPLGNLLEGQGSCAGGPPPREREVGGGDSGSLDGRHWGLEKVETAKQANKAE